MYNKTTVILHSPLSSKIDSKKICPHGMLDDVLDLDLDHGQVNVC